MILAFQAAKSTPTKQDMTYDFWNSRFSTADMLRQEFREGEILLLQEALTDLSEGPYHRGTAAVVRLILKSHPALQRA